MKAAEGTDVARWTRLEQEVASTVINAAIRPQKGAGDVGRHVRQQEHYRGRDLRHRAEALEWHVPRDGADAGQASLG